MMTVKAGQENLSQYMSRKWKYSEDRFLLFLHQNIIKLSCGYSLEYLIEKIRLDFSCELSASKQFT